MVVDAVVVGAGILGATAARALAARGLSVTLLDDGRPEAGTPPSGGHLRPGWFGGMPKREYEPAMALLGKLWDLKEERFAVRAPLLGTVTHCIVYRVDTDAVLALPRRAATVTGLGYLHNYPLVRYREGGEEGELRCRLLVLAAGCWAAELVPGLAVKARRGVSFRLRGELPGGEGVIRPWAPYKQVVAHRQAAGVLWAGDGTALKPEGWDPGRDAACLKRCRDALGGADAALAHAPVLETRHGLRPYCAGEGAKNPCLLRRLGPRAWLLTGAGKMGTIAAGWAALRILEALPE